MPRFVLLYHDCPPAYAPNHWDFMLEREGELWTWRLGALPAAWSKEGASRRQEPLEVSVERLADHRLDYLRFEGPLSGDRGRVTRYDAGTYEILEGPGRAIAVELSGAVLRGRANLTPINGDTWMLRVDSTRDAEEVY
jgi:hypothetical protein